MKNTKIENLKTTIANIDARKAELEAQRKTVSAAVEVVSQKFINREAKLEDVQTEEGKLDILNRTIATLDAQRTATSTELAAATIAGALEDAVGKAMPHLRRALAEWNEFNARRKALAELLAAESRFLADFGIRWHQAKNDVVDALRVVIPELNSLSPLVAPTSAIGEAKTALVQIGGASAEEIQIAFAEALPPNPVGDLEQVVQYVEQWGNMNRRAMGAASSPTN